MSRSKPAIRIRSRNIPTPKLIRWLKLDLGEKVTSIALASVEIMLTGAYSKSKSHFFPTSHPPFGLDDVSRHQPTIFDLHIAQAGQIYRYHLELLGRKVHQASLDYPGQFHSK